MQIATLRVFGLLTAFSIAPPPFESKLLFPKRDKAASFVFDKGQHGQQ